jgi:hypothetical protein
MLQHNGEGLASSTNAKIRKTSAIILTTSRFGNEVTGQGQYKNSSLEAK